MNKTIKRLLFAASVILIIAAVFAAVAFSHELFTTLPSSLAFSSHGKNAPMMVAHRGLSSLYPENSIPAFEGAVEYGFDGVEFDVHTTKDGKWVVIHDDTVDRTTDGEGLVEDFNYEEIRRLTLDGGNGIENHNGLLVPSLEEALDAIKGKDIIPVIEIKKCDVQYLSGLKDILDEYGLSDTVVLISFTREYLEQYRAIDSEAEILLLKSSPDTADVDWCVEYKAGLNFGYFSYYKTFKTISYAKEKGIKLGAWTVDNTAYMDVMVMAGVEIITTNKILP